MKRALALLGVLLACFGTSGFRQVAPTPQTVYSALWRIDHNFRSVIRIRNRSLSTAIVVRPVLYMQDGFAYELSAVNIPAAGMVSISVNDASAAAPLNVAKHLSDYGSVAIQFTSTSASRVSARVEMVDPVASLSYVSQCGARGAGSASTQELEGLWWKHDPGVGGFLVLTNTTDKPLSGNYQIVSATGRVSLPHNAVIAPHQVQWIDLRDLLPELPSREKVGGLRIAYQGKPGDILVLGGLENAVEGYSAMMQFVSALHDGKAGQVSDRRYASIGLMLGGPMPTMGFSPDTEFAIYSALRNTSDRPIRINAAFHYVGSSGSITVPVSPQELAPRQSKELDLKGMLKQAGLSDFSGTVDLVLSFTGSTGDLIVATGSVDNTGSYVFEVQAQGLAKSLSKEISYWSAANGNDTMIGLMNGSDTGQDLTVTFYPNGAPPYVLPMHLEPNSSTNLDIMELISLHKPDADGHVLPDFADGSAVVASAAGETKPMNLGVSVGVFNVKNATCTRVCVDCAGYTNISLSPNPFTLLPGGTQQMTAFGAFRDEPRNISNEIDVTDIVDDWSSSNGSVAAVSAGGLVTSVTGGPFTINAVADLTPDDGFSSQCDYQCITDEFFNGTSTGAVKPTISSISPGLGLIGTTVHVTISGTGLNNNPSIQAGTGITAVNVSATSSTQLTADLQIAANAPGGDHAVSVSTNGQTSSSSLTFHVQVPTKLVRLDFPGAPGGVGPLTIINNGNVVNLNGQTVATNDCGAYRNYAFDIEESNGTSINGTYTWNEMFSNYTTTVQGLTAPTTKSFAFTGDGNVTDIQLFATKAPACPGSNDHESFDMSFSVSVGGTIFNLSTILHIDRGYFSGAATVNSTIAIP